MLRKQDWALAPVYLYQAIKVKKHTVRLPEPDGERIGVTSLSDAAASLRIMVVGDSAAAGVGTQQQQDAFIGQLVQHLTQHPKITHQIGQIDWQLHATTGHTSFDILRRLYVLPTQPIDVMLFSVGVNDSTSNVSDAQWHDNLHTIIELASRKFADTQPPQLLFSSLPPMAAMPALPTPLNRLMGRKADGFSQQLQAVCAGYPQAHYLDVNLTQARVDTGLDAIQMFAADGFHPSSHTYHYWTARLSEYLAEQILPLLDTAKSP